MDSKQYVDRDEFTFGVVRFRSRALTCGKTDCSGCPHKGYWYAFVAAKFSKSGRRVEVYCGRDWLSDDLLAKVAPVLKQVQARAFALEICLVLDRERLEHLGREVINRSADLAQLIDRFERQKKQMQKEIAGLVRDRDRLHASLDKRG